MINKNEERILFLHQLKFSADVSKNIFALKNLFNRCYWIELSIFIYTFYLMRRPKISIIQSEQLCTDQHYVSAVKKMASPEQGLEPWTLRLKV